MRPDSESDDRRLDATLRKAFEPDAAALHAIVGRVEAAARGRSFPWARVAALILVALAVTGGVMWLEASGRKAEARREIARRWAMTYREAVANGYPAPGCCQPGVDLVGHCQTLYACPLQFCVKPDQQMVGFYCGTLCGKPGADATVLLMRSCEEPVCVFVEHENRDPRPDPAELGDLFVHRRALPPLVLYEVSRVRTPATLDGFSVSP